METSLISNETVKKLFQETWRQQSKYYDYRKPLFTQMFMGQHPLAWKDQHPHGCERHLSAFERYNIIPEYCFSCYKVLAEPRTVVELFKLMLVFERMTLEQDNTRKCMTENRPGVEGAYKGIIYSRSLTEAQGIAEKLAELIGKNISHEVPVTVKRGCSEYAARFPDYALPGTGTLEYNPGWQEIEHSVNVQWASRPIPAPGHIHQPGIYTAEDAQAMMGWLKYAATIGDASYRKISWPLQPFHNVTRPTPYTPPADDEADRN